MPPPPRIFPDSGDGGKNERTAQRMQAACQAPVGTRTTITDLVITHHRYRLAYALKQMRDHASELNEVGFRLLRSTVFVAYHDLRDVGLGAEARLIVAQDAEAGASS
jgi:hypothetical protein